MAAPPASATRYRGAQPFADDAISRRTFFGRRDAADALAAQIQANRLVVVYGKSGLGKSSLLNAGVAPLLREAGLQPLLLRLNDVGTPLAQQLMRAVQTEAERQHVEIVAGNTQSLWRCFRSLELWHGDVLAKPVLVIDQFEEMFTLHGDAAREAFLAEFGPLARGVAPAGESGAAPALHIVLSLREDFVGLLEDAADRIPQILDHRFRLRPLDRAAAADAMVGPAALVDATLATPPFTLAPAFVDAVLDYLTARADGGGGAATAAQVEPFHLQLICQRVEDIVAGRSVAANAARFRPGEAFTLAHFGGSDALGLTLKKFCRDAVDSLPDGASRRAARRLCQDYLISPEGRRLSIEEREITRVLGLKPEALAQLVSRRLLRTERRSHSLYYELGHDAMVEPILATQRLQRQLVGWGLIVVGAVLALLFWAIVLIGVIGVGVVLVQGLDNNLPTDVTPSIAATFAVLGLALYAMIAYGATKMFVAGRRHVRRYRKRDRSAAP